ncbi:hypothetical protein GF351_00270 [Candidatus Woesearchaeota archaeon]|nr:hypothetical protein [Candidatus Woesearchaeota archaeon]
MKSPMQTLEEVEEELKAMLGYVKGIETRIHKDLAQIHEKAQLILDEREGPSLLEQFGDNLADQEKPIKSLATYTAVYRHDFQGYPGSLVSLEEKMFSQIDMMVSEHSVFEGIAGCIFLWENLQALEPSVRNRLQSLADARVETAPLESAVIYDIIYSQDKADARLSSSANRRTEELAGRLKNSGFLLEAFFLYDNALERYNQGSAERDRIYDRMISIAAALESEKRSEAALDAYKWVQKNLQAETASEYTEKKAEIGSKVKQLLLPQKLKEDPDNPRLWEDMGNLHLQRDEWSDALTCYEMARGHYDKSTEGVSDDPKARGAVTKAYQMRFYVGSLSSIIRLCQDHAQGDLPVDDNMTLAQSFENLGKFEHAARHYDNVFAFYSAKLCELKNLSDQEKEQARASGLAQSYVIKKTQSHMSLNRCGEAMEERDWGLQC